MKVYTIPDLKPKNSKQDLEMAQEKVKCFMLSGFNLESHPKRVKKYVN